ncbi:hypothetical protein ACFV60_30580 [Streptomyces virginiae]|uniref:hypothetical protein n=1 Tax=Streptomyces virginiae TaxID=1961 RepID=UPI003646E59C
MDVLGPGEDIVSTWTGGPEATSTRSGTAMAAAHGAGIAATVLSEGIPPIKVFETIGELATKDAVTGLPGLTPNLLLYNDHTRH